MQKENTINGLYISLIIVVCNFSAIINLNSLISDDWACYWSDSKENVYFQPTSTIDSFLHYASAHVMAMSPYLARILILIFFMIPISCLFNYFLRDIVGLPRILSVTASVLPNILPGQNLIPAYIVGSYPVYILLPIMALFIFYHYIITGTSQNKIHMILLFTICFLIVYDLSYLYFIFFLPVFIVYVCLYAKNKLPAIATLIFLTLLGALRYIYYRAVDANFYHHAERLLPFAKMFYRFKMVIFKFTAPFYVFDQAWMNAHFKYIVMIAFLVIAIILVSAFTRNLDFHKRLKFTYFKNKKLKLAMVLLFFTVWAICTLITFLVASPAFLSYYVYIASFAINTIIVLLLYLLIDNFTRNKFILSLPCIVLIFVTGCVKIDESNKFNAQNNSAVKFLKNEINFLIMPDHSQIVVLNLPDKYTSISPGTWAKSMGIVKYVSQRTDLSGLIGREFTLYNPFEQKHEIIGWGNGMTGLSYKMPLFVFAYDNRNENLQQSEYFVVFTDSVHYNWKLFKLNKMDGSMTLRHEGAGLADYHALLKKEQDKLMNNVVWDDFL